MKTTHEKTGQKVGRFTKFGVIFMMDVKYLLLVKMLMEAIMKNLGETIEKAI